MTEASEPQPAPKDPVKDPAKEPAKPAPAKVPVEPIDGTPDAGDVPRIPLSFGGIKGFEPFERVKHRNGLWISLCLIAAIVLLQLVAVLVTWGSLPTLPADAAGLVEAREKTLTWGKDVIQVTTSSLAPILAAIAGYLFGQSTASKSSNEDAQGEEE